MEQAGGGGGLCPPTWHRTLGSARLCQEPQVSSGSPAHRAHRVTGSWLGDRHTQRQAGLGELKAHPLLHGMRRGGGWERVGGYQDLELRKSSEILEPDWVTAGEMSDAAGSPSSRGASGPSSHPEAPLAVRIGTPAPALGESPGLAPAPACLQKRHSREFGSLSAVDAGTRSPSRVSRVLSHMRPQVPASVPSWPSRAGGPDSHCSPPMSTGWSRT